MKELNSEDLKQINGGYNNPEGSILYDMGYCIGVHLFLIPAVVAGGFLYLANLNVD